MTTPLERLAAEARSRQSVFALRGFDPYRKRRLSLRASKEYRRWINRRRRAFGKSNGILPSGALDSPDIERKDISSKRYYRRHKGVILRDRS